jgi:hypothetical protein
LCLKPKWITTRTSIKIPVIKKIVAIALIDIKKRNSKQIMNMNNQTIFKRSALLIFPVLLWGCFEDHASQFHLDDINQVEWAPPDPSSSSLVYSAELEADQTESKTISLVVQLIGAQTGEDRSASVAVAEDNSDATEGEFIEILNQNNEVVIPANSNHGEVEVEILAENIGNGRDVFYQLELQEGSELGVAVNMKDMNLSIEKDAVSFSAEFEGDQDDDPSGSSSLTGLSGPDVFTADLSVDNFAPESTFEWQVHYGTCADGEDVVGDAGAYPAFETDEDGAGSAEAELEERIYQDEQYHIRVQDDFLNLEIACADYE